MNPCQDLLPGDFVTFYQFRTNIASRERYRRRYSTKITYVRSVSGVFIKYTSKFKHAQLRIPYERIPYEECEAKRLEKTHRVNHFKTSHIWCVIRNGIFLYTSK